MSAPNQGRPDEGAALLHRLQRLEARVAALGRGDRAKLLALMDDIATVRRKLAREAGLVEQQLNQAAVRVAAFDTYARVARATGSAHRRGS